VTVPVVLDKSFLDGAPTASVQSLCDNYSVLLTEELFYELITTRRESRRRCFAKFPDRTDPVCLIPSVGFLLTFEREHHAASTPVAQHRIEEAFQFNKKLRDGSYVLEGEVLASTENWQAQVRRDTNDFIERWPFVLRIYSIPRMAISAFEERGMIGAWSR